MIVRIEKSKDFTTISNFALNDPRLSLKAKGLWAFIMTKPDGWKINSRGIAAQLKEGRDAILSGMRELKEAGYLVEGAIRERDGKFSQNDSVLYEKPQPDNPWTENPTTENPTTKVNTKKVNTNTVANAPVGAPKEKNETLRLFYLVLKSYGLPVINHNHIKKWAIDLESSLGAEISELYLNRLLERNINDEGLKDRFIPQLTKPMDVLNKSQQIIQYLKRTKNTAPTPVNIDDTLERERLQEEEAKRIREA